VASGQRREKKINFPERAGGAPAGRFSGAIERINAHVRHYADAHPAGGRVSFLDCGSSLLAPGGDRIDAALMPDGVQPNAAGGLPVWLGLTSLRRACGD
jgi:hypothetical protein